jgi:hypothetical protein
MFEVDGCLTRSSYFEVTEEKDLAPDEILSVMEITACKGDVVELESYSGIDYFWSTGETSRSIEVTQSGVYDVIMSTNCNDYSSNEVNVFFADTNTPMVENDSVLIGQSAMFVGDTENLNWYLHKNDLEPIATGAEFVTPEIFEDQTYYVGEPNEGFGFNKGLMKVVPLNAVADTVYTENDRVVFEVLEELILYSVKVRTQRAGLRTIVISKEDEPLASYEVNLTVGVNTINIDFQFEPGIYTIGTDTEVNQTNLGTDHPQLSYSQIYTDSDKQIKGFLEIADSELYPGVSPYFFDWEIYYGYYYCEPRIPVQAIVKMPVSTLDITSHSYVYPNPTSGSISIRTDKDIPFNIDVLDVSGTKVMETITGDQSHMTIDLPDVSGMYFLKLTNKSSSEVVKVYVY